MMDKIIAVSASIFLLSACSEYSSREREGMERVKEQLFDPESAQFRNVHEGVERKNGWIVCGEVNGKNRFGGYTGFKKFSTTEKRGDVLIADESTAEGMIASALMEGLCRFPKQN